MIDRKKLFVIGSVFIVLMLIIVTATILLQPSKEENTKTDVTTTPFVINGLNNPKYLFSTETQAAIILGIEQYLEADNIKTDNVEGVIRTDSYTQREEGSATVSTLLIDIPSVKRTYKVSSSGSGDPNGDNSLFILCPSQDELRYGAFNCKDDTL